MPSVHPTSSTFPTDFTSTSLLVSVFSPNQPCSPNHSSSSFVPPPSSPSLRCTTRSIKQLAWMRDYVCSNMCSAFLAIATYHISHVYSTFHLIIHTQYFAAHISSMSEPKTILRPPWIHIGSIQCNKKFKLWKIIVTPLTRLRQQIKVTKC